MRERGRPVHNEREAFEKRGIPARLFALWAHCGRGARVPTHAATVAFRILTGLTGFSSVTGALLITSTTSIPLITRPKAANLPSSGGDGLTRMKKCVLAVFGSSDLAIETTPRS